MASISSKPRSDWDQLIKGGSTESLALFQTTFWAARTSDLFGYIPYYACVERDGRPVLMLVFFRSGFFIARGLRNRLVSLAGALKHRDMGIILWYGQPVARQGATEEDYRALVRGIREFAAEHRSSAVQGEWPLAFGGVLPSNWNTRKWATLKLDLDRPEEEIFKSLKSSARKAVRRARRDGIEVGKIENLEQLERYYSFAERCAKRYNKKLSGFRGFSSMWEYFRPLGIFETFTAHKDGELLAGLSVWGFGDEIGELGSFQSERSYREKLYGPDLIKWEIIRWAANEGISSFDLAGINPEPRDEKEKNIRRFKEKWGGTCFEYLQLIR